MAQPGLHSMTKMVRRKVAKSGAKRKRKKNTLAGRVCATHTIPPTCSAICTCAVPPVHPIPTHSLLPLILHSHANVNTNAKHVHVCACMRVPCSCLHCTTTQMQHHPHLSYPTHLHCPTHLCHPSPFTSLVSLNHHLFSPSHANANTNAQCVCVFVCM